MEQGTYADNFTDATQNVDNNVALNATVSLPPTLPIPTILWVVRLVGLSVGIAGIIANSVVLVVLILARRQFGSSVNTLIINQTVMDLLSCTFVCLIVVVGTQWVKLDYTGNKIADTIACNVVRNGIFASTAQVAGRFGLVVITLERYFKIVHAIAHRKYYRSWMTTVGVVLPWIGGACLNLLPMFATTRVINERCIRMAVSVWPNKGMKVVRLLQFMQLRLSVVLSFLKHKFTLSFLIAINIITVICYGHP